MKLFLSPEEVPEILSRSCHCLAAFFWHDGTLELFPESGFEEHLYSLLRAYQRERGHKMEKNNNGTEV